MRGFKMIRLASPWLFSIVKKFKTCKKFGILFVTSIPTKLSLSLKKFWELSMEKAHLRAIFKNLLCDQDNFSKWEILHKWDILRRKQSTAKRSTMCYISQRIGWVIKGRLSNLWGTACKVLTEVAIEYIPSRSTTSQLLNGNVSLEILRKEAFFI